MKGTSRYQDRISNGSIGCSGIASHEDVLQLHTSGLLGMDHSGFCCLGFLGGFSNRTVQNSAFSGLPLRSVGTEKIASRSLGFFCMFHRC